MSDNSEHRRQAAGWMVASLVVFAALLRAGALFAWSGHLTDDRDDYLTVANQYVEHGFWNRFEKFPSAFRPPLYPLVLAAILKHGGGPVSWGLLQLLLGIATVALTYFAGRRLGLGTGALVAAGLVALDPLLIEYTTFPMTETLFTFLVALLIVVALPAGTAPTRTGPENSAVPGLAPAKPPFRLEVFTKAAAVGAVFGACALCRPTIWPTAGLAALWFWWSSRRKHLPAREILFAGGTAAVFIAIVVFPWGLRNEKILGSPVVTTTHGGYTLLLGNNEAFFHAVAARPFVAEWTDPEPDRFQRLWLQNLVVEMDRELGPQADEIAQDRWMYQRAWQSIRAAPRLFVRACVLRFILFWNVVPLAPSRSAISAPVVWGMCIGYVIELGLFVIGILGLLRNWDDRWGLSMVVILNFALVHLLFWSNMRMRAPLVPLIALVASRAIDAWWNRRKVNKCVADPDLVRAT